MGLSKTRHKLNSSLQRHKVDFKPRCCRLRKKEKGDACNLRELRQAIGAVTCRDSNLTSSKKN